MCDKKVITLESGWGVKLDRAVIRIFKNDDRSSSGWFEDLADSYKDIIFYQINIDEYILGRNVIIDKLITSLSSTPSWIFFLAEEIEDIIKGYNEEVKYSVYFALEKLTLDEPVNHKELSDFIEGSKDYFSPEARMLRQKEYSDREEDEILDTLAFEEGCISPIEDLAILIDKLAL